MSGEPQSPRPKLEIRLSWRFSSARTPGSRSRPATAAAPPLGLEVEEQLYRLGQEALANVVKHARADTATVRIAGTGNTVSIEVSDDGHGFDPAAVGPDHFGLRSMRGRVADLGGRLEVTSTPGRGTVLRVVVPAQR